MAAVKQNICSIMFSLHVLIQRVQTPVREVGDNNTYYGMAAVVCNYIQTQTATVLFC